MSATANGDITRRIVACVLGVLGVVILLDVLVVVLVLDDPDLSAWRQTLLIVVAALLLIGGVVTFAWPKRGSVRTTDPAE